MCILLAPSFIPLGYHQNRLFSNLYGSNNVVKIHPQLDDNCMLVCLRWLKIIAIPSLFFFIYKNYRLVRGWLGRKHIQCEKKKIYIWHRKVGVYALVIQYRIAKSRGYSDIPQLHCEHMRLLFLSQRRWIHTIKHCVLNRQFSVEIDVNNCVTTIQTIEGLVKYHMSDLMVSE